MKPRRISGNRTAEDILRSYYEELGEKKNKGQNSGDRKITPSNIANPGDYIILEGNQPDLLVPINRLGLTQETGQALRDLNFYDNLTQRAGTDNNRNQKPLDPLGFLGYINHEEAQSLALKLNGFVLPANLYGNFLKLLIDGTENKAKVYDGNGNIFPSTGLTQVLNEITEVRTPWRAEHLDCRFNMQSSGDEQKLHIKYHKFDGSGKLIECDEVLDENTLMSDKVPGIKLHSWLENPTSQGLPRKEIGTGDLWYWCPRNGAVGRFGASSGGVSLSCNLDPQGSDSAFGVRVAKIK